MPEAPKNLVGSHIRKLRMESGKSQEAFAALLQRQGWDLSRGTLAKIEAGLRRINDGELFLLCRALGCRFDDLFQKTRVSQALSVARHGES